jgi:hypothetical protein
MKVIVGGLQVARIGFIVAVAHRPSAAGRDRERWVREDSATGLLALPHRFGLLARRMLKTPGPMGAAAAIIAARAKATSTAIAAIAAAIATGKKLEQRAAKHAPQQRCEHML